MKKILGLALLILAIGTVAALLSRDPSGNYVFLSGYNLENLLARIGRFGVLSVAAAIVIVTGGIDLSIGSVVCVAGCLLPYTLRDLGLPPYVGMAVVLTVTAAIGLFQGLCIVMLRLQPFVVTLCGLLLYRGIMRAFTAGQTMGFDGTADALQWLATGRIPIAQDFGIPVPFVVLAVVAVLTALLWRATVAGRHLFALGHNEEAARFAGVPTKRLTVLAYVLCSVLAGLGGCLFVLDVNSAQAASFGSFYELYAIAGAVLGGTALRGGEGMVLGVVLGASLMQLLSKTVNLVAGSNRLESAVVGAVILVGAAMDEGVRRYWGRRRSAGP